MAYLKYGIFNVFEFSSLSIYQHLGANIFADNLKEMENSIICSTFWLVKVCEFRR